MDAPREGSLIEVSGAEACRGLERRVSAPLEGLCERIEKVDDHPEVGRLIWPLVPVDLSKSEPVPWVVLPTLPWVKWPYSLA